MSVFIHFLRSCIAHGITHGITHGISCGIALSLLLSTSLAFAQTSAGPNIVVSIRPLHALVAELMQGVAVPRLLLENSESAHHASLRPSQMRALSQADLLFWIGPELEGFLPRVIHSLGIESKSAAMLANPALMTLAARNSHGHAAVAGESMIDPHVWLSSDHVEIMLAAISAQLKQLDPAHASIYQRNHARMQQDISRLRTELRRSFTAGARYFSYHDGYQYFEQEVGLQHVGSVSNNEELQPSARHIRALRQQLQQQNIHCLVYDAPLRPALIDTLLEGSRAQAVELDAMGLRQHSASWFELMRTLASDFSRCLSPQSTKN